MPAEHKPRRSQKEIDNASGMKASLRVGKMLSEIKRLENQPLDQPQVFSSELEPGPEVALLRARIQALETQLKEMELNGATPSGGWRPAAAILYEKENLGYIFHAENLTPLEMSAGVPRPENPLITAFEAGGQVIGEMQIESPPQHEWDESELGLASAVARQASLQIQNLSLLAATERARAEAQAATRQFTHQNWQAFLDGIHENERIGYAYDQNAVTSLTDLTPAESDYHENVSVLDEQVGRLSLQTDPAHPLTVEDKALVAAVARQLAQQVENLRLLADASRARSDAEAATRRLMRESWETFAVQQGRETLGFKYDTLRVSPLQSAIPLETMDFVQRLMVRGESIGQLAVSGLKNISPEARELAAAIGEQVSIHLENLRLFELNEKRARELETVAVVSTTASTVLDPDDLLQSVVNLTKERFHLYHAQIYLADESWRTLLLASGAGEVGRQMVTTGHAIPMDSQKSIVARAAAEKQPSILENLQQEVWYEPNHLLLEARSEMAIPMIVGDQIIGVFDVLSDKIGTFTAEDATIYSTLAVQVAIALQNARLYAEQAATVTRLRELDRLKSSFLANMSHELRTPLNSILGFADVILEGLDGPMTANMQTDLGLIQKNGQHLLLLINDVLDMAKIEAGKMNLNLERFSIQEVITEVMGITSHLANQKGLDLVFDPDSDQAVEITADRIRFRQVMINLINNALKFTEKGSVVIRTVRQDNHVLIRFQDTGLGIPPEHLESVFQEFTQVDTSTTRKVGGTGLGLPISRRLIEMHGGRLWAESTGIAGQGSTFYVFLPLEAKLTND
jgi:signal transduction histidine kinase